MEFLTEERSTGRMSDANQVRINELARELEVKAKAIIDLLPGYGVTEKKTHSSSIPADVAEKVRKNILGQAEAEAAAEAAAKADKDAKDAAARVARMRPATPPTPAAAAPVVAAK
ncbi:MAG: translation initiation factor IF-2 N-terminal domain-containing protein, partial [Candidatus Acidiferrum sp.]